MSHRDARHILIILCVFGLTGCGLFATSMYRTVDYRPIHEAVLNGDIEKVRQLIGADHRAVNAPDYDGNTPLHLAVLRGKTNIVVFLLSKGADVNAKNHAQITPVIFAARGGRLEIVQQLLNRKPNLNMKDSRGFTALDWAVRAKHEDIAELLRNSGATN
jgi:uncharacterized protein